MADDLYASQIPSRFRLPHIKKSKSSAEGIRIDPSMKECANLEAVKILSCLDQVIEHAHVAMAMPFIINNLDKFAVTISMDMVQMFKRHNRILQNYYTHRERLANLQEMKEEFLNKIKQSTATSSKKEKLSVTYLDLLDNFDDFEDDEQGEEEDFCGLSETNLQKIDGLPEDELEESNSRQTGLAGQRSHNASDIAQAEDEGGAAEEKDENSSAISSRVRSEKDENSSAFSSRARSEKDENSSAFSSRARSEKDENSSAFSSRARSEKDENSSAFSSRARSEKDENSSAVSSRAKSEKDENTSALPLKVNKCRESDEKKKQAKKKKGIGCIGFGETNQFGGYVPIAKRNNLPKMITSYLACPEKKSKKWEKTVKKWHTFKNVGKTDSNYSAREYQIKSDDEKTEEEEDQAPSFAFSYEHELDDELRAVGVISEQIAYSFRNLLKKFPLGSAAMEMIKKEAWSSTKGFRFLSVMRDLRETMQFRLCSSYKDQMEREAYLETVLKKDKHNEAVLAKLREDIEIALSFEDDDEQLNAAESYPQRTRCPTLSQYKEKCQVLKCLQVDLIQIEKFADEAIRRSRAEAEKTELAEAKTSETKIHDMQEDIDTLLSDLNKDILSNKETEADLRNEKYKLETEIDSWIKKYDDEMIFKQEAIETIEMYYADERIILAELEETYYNLKVAYDAIMEERHMARVALHMMKATFRHTVIAVLVIQSLWRSHCVRKAMAVDAKKKARELKKKLLAEKKALKNKPKEPKEPEEVTEEQQEEQE
ncbi:myosin-3-like [Physella acuta]|uniref:myosin-3-like n=1 Tax=Physella acuta TaxID=109671 RepID=UPI0027DE5829|nr:myosin-3-like [Physella acuta]